MAAKLIDFIVGWGPALAAFAVLKVIGLRLLLNGVNGNSIAIAVLLLTLAVAGWGVWYTFTKDGNARGAGVGKRAMRLAVIDIARDGPCTKGQCAIRQLILHVAYLVPVLGWFTEPLTMMLTTGGRRVGDLLAGTQVVSADEYARVQRSPSNHRAAA